MQTKKTSNRTIPQVVVGKAEGRKLVNFKLPPMLVKKLDEASVLTNRTKTKIVEMALLEFLNRKAV